MSYHFDSEKAITSIKEFIRSSLADSGLDGYVIGLSGGIDSALSASLAVAAVGREKILGVMMPYRTSADNSRADALELIGKLGLEYRSVDISPMIDAYYDRIEDALRVRAGNKMARERMSILFDLAHQTHRLVLGTGNRTEFCLGYTTLFGDAACSVNPIGELYKTEVRILARELGVPVSILNKPPTADLWASQTDEGEIGVSYEEIDAILQKIVDEKVTSRNDLELAGLNLDSVNRVVALLTRNAFKRALPPVGSLGRGPVPASIALT